MLNEDYYKQLLEKFPVSEDCDEIIGLTANMIFHNYRSENNILQFVEETMSQQVNDLQFDEHLAQANEWEGEIARIKLETDNQRYALIHNIARVSREILVEARGLKEVYEEEVN